MNSVILGIESSCDDTSAAIVSNGTLLSNIVSGQLEHSKFGGVVPELASRSHQQHIVPVVDEAIKKAQINITDISAIAFTRGPGLLGSLLVGISFAKGMSLALDKPLIEVNHLQAHVLSHFIVEPNKNSPSPQFPFLCLLVSGGHTQLIVVDDFLTMHTIGQTIDDAAGEAFDKCAKIMGLPYPGGPIIDELAKKGNPNAFNFAKPNIPDLNFSFSGLKTSVLYFLRDKCSEDNTFIEKNKNDICASLQRTIAEILIDKIIKAAKQTSIKKIAIAGGVSANSYLQLALQQTAMKYDWELFIPPLKFSTDNAAMIATCGYYKFLKKQFVSHDITPLARYEV